MTRNIAFRWRRALLLVAGGGTIALLALWLLRIPLANAVVRRWLPDGTAWGLRDVRFAIDTLELHRIGLRDLVVVGSPGSVEISRLDVDFSWSDLRHGRVERVAIGSWRAALDPEALFAPESPPGDLPGFDLAAWLDLAQLPSDLPKIPFHTMAVAAGEVSFGPNTQLHLGPVSLLREKDTDTMNVSWEMAASTLQAHGSGAWVEENGNLSLGWIVEVSDIAALARWATEVGMVTGGDSLGEDALRIEGQANWRANRLDEMHLMVSSPKITWGAAQSTQPMSGVAPRIEIELGADKGVAGTFRSEAINMGGEYPVHAENVEGRVVWDGRRWSLQWQGVAGMDELVGKVELKANAHGSTPLDKPWPVGEAKVEIGPGALAGSRATWTALAMDLESTGSRLDISLPQGTVALSAAGELAWQDLKLTVNRTDDDEVLVGGVEGQFWVFPDAAILGDENAFLAGGLGVELRGSANLAANFRVVDWQATVAAKVENDLVAAQIDTRMQGTMDGFELSNSTGAKFADLDRPEGVLKGGQVDWAIGVGPQTWTTWQHLADGNPSDFLGDWLPLLTGQVSISVEQVGATVSGFPAKASAVRLTATFPGDGTPVPWSLSLAQGNLDTLRANGFALEGLADAVGAQFSGQFQWARTLLRPHMRGSVSWQEALRGEAEVALADTTLVGTEPWATLAPALAGYSGTGSISADARVTWTAGTEPVATGELRLAGLDVESKSPAFTISSLQGRIVLADLLTGRSADEQVLTWDTLAFGDFQLTRGEVHFTVKDYDHLHLAALSASALGGRIWLDPMDLDLANESGRGLVHIEEVFGSEVLALLGWVPVSFTGLLSGQQPFALMAGLVRPSPGFLELAPGSKSRLRMDPPRIMTPSVGRGNVMYPALAEVENALAELSVDRLQIALFPPSGRSAEIRIEAAPTSPRVKAPVRLDINVNAPLGELLDLGQRLPSFSMQPK